MMEDYRKGEEGALDFVKRIFGQTFSLTGRDKDFGGIDLESEDGTIGGYVRTRFHGFRDLTFNGRNAITKLKTNVETYPGGFFAVLQYADGSSFKDPDFAIRKQIIIDLSQFVRDAHEAQSKLLDLFDLKTKNADGSKFFIWEDWQNYVRATE